MNANLERAGMNPLFLAFFPDLADDSYATIGLDGPCYCLALQVPPILLWWRTQPCRQPFQRLLLAQVAELNSM